MNSEIKKRWIAALRSGEYKQTTHQLKKHKNFCCLGVLTDLYLIEKGRGWGTGGIRRSNELLSVEVVDWANLKNMCPVVKPPLGWDLGPCPRPGGKEHLTNLNDGAHFQKQQSFKMIASLIEEDRDL